MGNSCAKIDDDKYLELLDLKHVEILYAIEEAKTPKEIENANVREAKLHTERERIRWNMGWEAEARKKEKKRQPFFVINRYNDL